MLVGNTDTSPYDRTSGNAIAIGDGLISSAQSGGNAAIFNRMTSAGSIIGLRNDGSTVGSIGASAGLYIASAACGLRLHSGGTKIFPTNSSGGAADGTVDLGAVGGSWKDAYLSGGVYLGGTGSANKLDDYEEGTWTPFYIIGATQFTYTTSQDICKSRQPCNIWMNNFLQYQCRLWNLVRAYLSSLMHVNRSIC